MATSSRTHAARAGTGRLSGAARLTGSVRSMFDTGGRGFRHLAVTQVFSTACDTLVALGLAGTLFFTVPSAEARGNVALYLLLTVAPFAIIGPSLGRLLDRTPVATRTVLMIAAAGRCLLALSLVGASDRWWLFPAAFGLLVFSRVHGITRNSLLPLALDAPSALVAANARLAWIGVLAGGLAGGIGLVGLWLLDANGPLLVAGLAGAAAAWVGRRLPAPDASSRASTRALPPVRLRLDRNVRMAQLATAGVRTFNGFLLLLIAFELQEAEAGLLDFAGLLAAAGGGFAIASRIVPLVERRVREEPMVVGALALTAGAAFVAGQWFGLVAAAALAGAAGLAWGVAKLAFDGLLQASVPTSRRGAAFTRSETLFSVAWVVGAIIPTAVPLSASVGLALAGLAALAAQIVYVGALLVPTERPRRGDDPGERPPPVAGADAFDHVEDER
ncbi:MAG: hypothetical protein JJT89_08975 [Nitriliruptoraceae bacterium]|nr:hypothetical protein [Nitriliruptoraceae bacterium]